VPQAFDPPDEAAQRALGARALDVVRDAGRRIHVVVEDLGDIPPFVREAMRARNLPGYRVLRWEQEEGRFADPATFPPVSVATTGTHDTSTLAVWWSDELDDATRRRLAAVGLFEGLAGAGSAFTPAVHEALVGGLYAAGSATALLVAPDLFGERTRINTPATVGAHNWGYRLPLGVEALAGPAGRARAAWLRRLAERHGRSG
jgi:4-alpha-glucanotransferase